MHAIEKEEEKQNVNMMTIVILISVIIGMLAGYFVIREIFEGNMGVFESAAGLGIKLGLCLLLIFVGIDLGIEGSVISNFKAVGLRICLLYTSSDEIEMTYYIAAGFLHDQRFFFKIVFS